MMMILDEKYPAATTVCVWVLLFHGLIRLLRLKCVMCAFDGAFLECCRGCRAPSLYPPWRMGITS